MSRHKRFVLNLTRPSALGWACLLTGMPLFASSLFAQTKPAMAQVAPHISTSALPPIAPSTRFAVLVGISDYPGTEEDLGGGPLNDVKLMADLLVNKFGFDPSDILMLTDAQATKTNIHTAFVTFLAKAPENGVVVFYFSGHGTQLPDDSGDEPDGLDETLVVLGDAPDTWAVIRDDELGWLAGLLPSRHILIVLDNCYSGTGTRGIARTPSLATIAGGHAQSLQLASSAPSSERPRMAKRIPTDVFASLHSEAAAESHSIPASAPAPTTHLLLAAASEHEESLNLPVRLDDGTEVRVGLFTAALYGQVNASNLRTTTFTGLIADIGKTTRNTTAQLHEGPQTPQAEGVQQGQTLSAFLQVP